MVKSIAISHNKRLGLRKVRTGCVTCRLRRIKCDEEKPQCQQCVKRNINCGGYERHKLLKEEPRGLTRGSKQTRQLLPRISPQRVMLPGITENWFQSQHEYNYFQTFCTATVFDILPSFQSRALRQTLLQSCASLPSIRLAVTALGALDTTSSTISSLTLLSLDNEKRRLANYHHQNALQTYSRAVQQMREDNASDEANIQIALLMCLVITCFEAWNGNHELAMKQICLAFRLINAWKDNDYQQSSTKMGTSKHMEDDLMVAFSRLDVQVISAEDSVRGFSAFSEDDENLLLDAMPLIFFSMDEAEKFETILVRQCMRFVCVDIGSIRPFPTKYNFPVNGYRGVKVPEIVSKQRSLLSHYTHWLSAFDPLWNRIGTTRFNNWWQWRNTMQGKPNPTTLGQLRDSANANLQSKNQDFEQAAMYRVHIFTAFLALIAICTEDEREYDAYNPIFAEIIDLVQILLEGQASTRDFCGPKFSFDAFVIIPLNIAGQKCRDPIIRRAAIGLLHKYPRREGIWDSVLIVKMIEWVMMIEEENIEEGFVPGWARLGGFHLERNMQMRMAVLSCEQRLSVKTNKTKAVNTVVTW